MAAANKERRSLIAKRMQQEEEEEEKKEEEEEEEEEKERIWAASVFVKALPSLSMASPPPIYPSVLNGNQQTASDSTPNQWERSKPKIPTLFQDFSLCDGNLIVFTNSVDVLP